MSRTNKANLTGGKAVDRHCRNNGKCPYCLGNRTISGQREKSKSVAALREYLQTTNPAELSADWEAVEKMAIEGPTLSATIQYARAIAYYLPLLSGIYDA